MFSGALPSLGWGEVDLKFCGLIFFLIVKAVLPAAINWFIKCVRLLSTEWASQWVSFKLGGNRLAFGIEDAPLKLHWQVNSSGWNPI